MMDWVVQVVALVVALIVHELGHYAGFQGFGYKPDIKFKWWRVSVGENISWMCSLKEMIIILLVGINAGLAVLILVGVSSKIILLYLLFSANDMTILFEFFGTKNLNQSVLDLVKSNTKELIINAEKTKRLYN